MRNHMDVNNVENTSIKYTTLKHTREFTLERNHISVTCVRRHLVSQHIYDVTGLCIPDLNPFLVVNVEKVLHGQTIWKVMSAPTWKRKLATDNSSEKSFSRVEPLKTLVFFIEVLFV